MQKKKIKTKSRGNGEGSVYHNGKYWVAQVTIGRDSGTGKLKRKSIYGKTRAEVVEKMTTTLHQLNTNTFIEPSKITMLEWSEYWLENFKKNQIGESTYSHYRYFIKNHIRKPFQNILIADINLFTIQNYLNNLETPHLARYVNMRYNLIFKQAIKSEILSKNPCDGIALPKLNQKKEVLVLTQKEQRIFVEYCYNDTTRGNDIYIFLLGTGLRVGEALALTWDNVNFEEDNIFVDQTVTEIRGKSKINKDTKTFSSTRKIPISKKIELLLKSRKQFLDSEKNIMNLVFPSRKFSVISSANLRRKLDTTCERADVKRINIHALRHTFATRLLESDANIKVVSSLLGHKDITITLNTYSHVLPDFKKDNMDKIDAFI